jgi:hypothetical protein
LSHARHDYPYAGPVKVREPIARPLDVVAAELLLTAGQAFLAGVLLYLALGLWQDQGVGGGAVAAVPALMGLAVGGAWLYWLLGGVGWPMAAANAPAGIFLAAALILGGATEDGFLRVSGAPLLLSTLAAGYGVVAGVFLDSPRRLRWDQRERVRPGTRVPRVTPTTQAVVARVPRSLPRRPSPEPASSELARRIEQAPHQGTVVVPDDGRSTDGASAPMAPRDADDLAAGALDAARAEPGLIGPSPAPQAGTASGLSDAPDVVGVPIEAPSGPEPVAPAPRTGRASVTSAPAGSGTSTGEIELPTMIEPRAQRSPWAWAAPPEWNRDEDDEAMTRSSKRRR